MWSEMTEAEKKPFIDKAAKDKIRFQTAKGIVLGGKQLTKQGLPLKRKNALRIINGVVIKKPKNGFLRYRQMRLAEN